MEDILNPQNKTSGSTSTVTTPQVVVPVTDAKSDALLKEEVGSEDLDIKWARWKCLVCGYVYEGHKHIKKCPRCGNEDPDKFEDVD